MAFCWKAMANNPFLWHIAIKFDIVAKITQLSGKIEHMEPTSRCYGYLQYSLWENGVIHLALFHMIVSNNVNLFRNVILFLSTVYSDKYADMAKSTRHNETISRRHCVQEDKVRNKERTIHHNRADNSNQ